MQNINRLTSCAVLLILSLWPITPTLAINKPEVMLAKVFRPSVDVSHYWISEKLDGVRARWDGQQLISRGGTLLNAPEWFTQNFPKTILDGELWIARGEYQQTVSIVRKQQPHLGWKKIKFMIFDLPDHGGYFSDRVSMMQQMANQSPSPYLKFIDQFQVASREQLMQHLQIITAQGGEGLMLHHKKGLYHSGRSLDLLKLKPFSDAEAIVTGYRPGKGQFTGKMGALQVKAADGKAFFIGSGFSHQERDTPPPIGSTISYRYQGFTDSGIPRFAVFLRIRDEPE
ncbi:MAG: DNA ligase [Methylococcaceae bacterium]|nr:DNA ligase [Methylococcaceae bacterium]